MHDHILIEVFQKAWAILPEKWAAIAESVKLRDSGHKSTLSEISSASRTMGAARKPSGGRQFGSVAVLPIHGVISQRANFMMEFFGGVSLQVLTAQFREALADPNVKAIVLDVDSPGGGVEGVPELAAEIQAARGQKKITAVANSMAASAAYWLASAADELCVTPSGSVGSIGVFAAHEDYSRALESEGIKISLVSAGKYKTEANPYQPLSDEARANLQAEVDAFYTMFVKAVASGRGVSQASVRSGFGEGRMVLAREAVKAGMADRVGTLEDAINTAASRQRSATGRTASGEYARRLAEIELI